MPSSNEGWSKVFSTVTIRSGGMPSVTCRSRLLDCSFSSGLSDSQRNVVEGSESTPLAAARSPPTSVASMSAPAMTVLPDPVGADKVTTWPR